MARLIHRYDNDQAHTSARIYYDPHLAEYIVKLYQEDQHLVNADYFTNDADDAHGTARILARIDHKDQLTLNLR